MMVKCVVRSVIVAVALSAFVGRSAIAEPREIPLWQMQLQFRMTKNISCDFNQVPLTEVIQFFRTALDINIVVEDQIGRAAETPVTLNLKDVPGASAMNIILRQARLSYVMADGVLYITTPERAREKEPVAFRQYDVNDIIFSPAALRNSTTATSSTAATTQQGGAVTAGASTRASEDLTQVIVIFTGPENWDNVASPGTTSSSAAAPAAQTKSR